jgi:hypothetical protein
VFLLLAYRKRPKSRHFAELEHPEHLAHRNMIRPVLSGKDMSRTIRVPKPRMSERLSSNCAPRVWAEALARLDPARPPGDVPLGRWVRFIDDCGRFLDDGWAYRAEVLGWGPLHLFGCDRERPWARIDRAGLIWLLDGHKIIAFTADTAVTETATGARQTYRRVAIEPGQVVLAWELE